jgi:uncharacterized sodium:solute symporter family permease YidK
MEPIVGYFCSNLAEQILISLGRQCFRYLTNIIGYFAFSCSTHRQMHCIHVLQAESFTADKVRTVKRGLIHNAAIQNTVNKARSVDMTIFEEAPAQICTFDMTADCGV